ncbi:MAG: hypothetical protein GXO62_04910 [Epsilonproteobacteria bacterium]|nr:hypothetical protein [Campylobacterota bacterium]
MLKNKISFIFLGIIAFYIAAITALTIHQMEQFEKCILKEAKNVTIKSIKEELKDYLDIISQNIHNLEKIYSVNPKEITKKEMDRLFVEYLIPLYEKYKNDPRLKDILLEFIANYRYKISPFGKNNGYFAVIDANIGKVIAHPLKKCKGKNLSQLPKVEQKFVKEIKYRYQGFFEVDCPLGKKYIYIKYFKPFNWILITPVDDKSLGVTEKVIYNIIKNIRFGNQNYYFAYKYKNKTYTYVIHPYLTGKLDMNQTDIKGKHFKIEMMKKAMNNGGYTTYYFKNLATGKIEEKITYAKYYPQLGLVLAVGTYIKEIEKTILKPAKDEIDKSVVTNVVRTLVFSLILLAISFMIFHHLVDKFLTHPIEELNHTISSIKDQDCCKDESVENIIENFATFTQRVDQQLKDIIKRLKGI